MSGEQEPGRTVANVLPAGPSRSFGSMVHQ